MPCGRNCSTNIPSTLFLVFPLDTFLATHNPTPPVLAPPLLTMDRSVDLVDARLRDCNTRCVEDDRQRM